MSHQNQAMQVLAFDAALELFDVCSIIVIDTETNADDIRDGRGYAVGVSLASRLPGVGICAAYLPFRHGIGPNYGREELFKLKQKIESYTGYLVFHNAKFDLVSLQTLGINYTGKFYCSMQIAHLLNEELPYDKSLNSCVRHYVPGLEGKKDDATFKGFVKMYGYGGMPSEAMRAYAEWDAVITYRLIEVLLVALDIENLNDYWEIKQKFYAVIIAMESRGVTVDTDLCRRMINHGEIAMDEIVELLGGLNPGSNKDLQILLLERLGLPVVKRSKKTGAPSFDKTAMEEYELMLELRDDDTARYILEYRGWQKSVSSNYRPYVELLSLDGRLRPNYKLHGTKTGRMSCEKPNLQQIPRVSSKAWNGEMKNAFLPQKGYSLYEADYGQLELRLAAAYAKEEGLKRVFAEGRDVFTEMSKQLGMARHDAKTLTYTIQYGGGINRISTVFGFSSSRAQQVRNNFYNTYPGFRAVGNNAKRKVESKGSVRLWSERSRHFLYPKDESHKAFNAVIQGGSADIVERTMVRLFEQVDNSDECRMLLQVHDSIVFEIKDELVSTYLPKIQACMEAVEPDFGVRFAVDVHKWGS